MAMPSTFKEYVLNDGKFEDPFYQTDEERKAELERLEANYERANMIAKKGPKEITVCVSFDDEVKAKEGLSKIVNALDGLELQESSLIIFMNAAKGETK